VKSSIVKVLAFVKRDFLIESSYKVAFVLDLASCTLPVLMFYFIGKFVPTESSSAIEHYGGYFGFALVGIALTQYFNAALRVFASSVRRAQMTGVLEAMLSTQTSPREVILYSAAYAFLSSTLYVAIVLALGALLGVSFHRADPISVGATFLLTIAAFAGLGLLSATVILLLKKGDPVESLLASASALLGGAFFPIAVMPAWLRPAAKVLPITYALEAMRDALFRGSSLGELRHPLGVLAVMSLFLIPASLWSFSRAVEASRRDGSLIQY
jgi:ABC-2 type transport system permease protein